jgi:hypothetical protein
MEIVFELIKNLISLIFGGIKGRKHDKKEKNIQTEVDRKNRPEFQVINMKDHFQRPGYTATNNTCDIEAIVVTIQNVKIVDGIIMAQFDNEILNQDLWICREYTMKNIGKTPVYEIAVISNFKKDTCLFNISNFDKSILKNGFLNYFLLFDRRVGVGECFTLKLCYNKDMIITSFYSAIMELGMRDDNGHYWAQPFFSPNDKLYESRRISHMEYRESILPDTAIECFKKPWLW